MNYKQHKHVGDCLVVQMDPDTAGKIVFTQRETIAYTSREFYNDIRAYNPALADMDLDQFRDWVDRDRLVAHVRRSFGDINAWAGDHAKIHPPDGKAKTFEELNVQLQVVANTHDFDYVALALANWDHFMPMSYQMWEQFHLQALRLAQRFAGQGGDRRTWSVETDGQGTTLLIFDIETDDLAQAIFLDAYGCHFLEDCFASGHLRTPRLLFGKDMDSLRAGVMHGKDNELRLVAKNRAGETFRLVGESSRDDFSNPENIDNDQDLKQLRDRALAAVTTSVQQVIDVAMGRVRAGEVKVAEISRSIPVVEIFWSQLPADSSRTHALVVQPLGAGPEYPKPAYTFRANFDPDSQRFQDPTIFKLRDNGTYRKLLLGDVDYFTPGIGLASWVPATADQRVAIPN